MLNRFPGLLLIGMGVAMAVAGCGDAAGAGDGAAVGPTVRFSARYPTATLEISDAKEAVDPLKGVAAFNAQRARSWPTAVGWPGPTASPPPAPVDKSDWTIIEPGECDPKKTAKVGDLDELRRRIFAFISASWADDQADAVDMADLIIHGIPVGNIELEPARHRGSFDRFYQDVRILSVLNGQAPGGTVRVVHIAGTGENHGYSGPLGQCPQILFLNESPVDIYLSVGLAQRVFSLGADGRVTFGPGLESFEGLEADQGKNTGISSIEAQLARGWPTAVGWPGPTATPSPTPVDKSNWTIIEPVVCVPGMATTVGELVRLKREMYAFIDISSAADETELVRMADLIIHGLPVGEIEVRPPRNSLNMTTYYQDVQVLSVLRGQAPGDIVRVLQIGFDWPTRPENLEKYEIELGSGFNESYPGPLNQCPQILFITGPAAGVFASVGETQGVFQLGPGERIFYAQEFVWFVGLDVSQVKQRIESLSLP